MGTAIHRPSLQPLPALPWRWLAIPILLSLLGLLVWAEVHWLPDGLPREYATRASIVIIPPGGGPRVEQLADALGLPALDATAAKPGQLTSTVVDVTPADNQEVTHAEVGSQCIELATEPGHPQRGLLVTVVARGLDHSAIESVAAAWSDSLTARAEAAAPGVIVKPLPMLTVPYQFCAER
ncbi:MAG: hypothetical protein HYY04_12610 [Chloroflexi bacterium]|nr:hypothetical protein [Chloroflexota bacterium]